MAIETLGGFFKNKSVLPTFKFEGTFIDKNIPTTALLKSYHIRSVSYEQHTFKQEGQYHGPGILKTFPVLDRGEGAGAYRLSLVLEEDSHATVQKFIEYLKKKIINSNGLYNTIDAMKSMEFDLKIFTTPSYTIKFQEVYFQTAEANDFSYAETDMKAYTVILAYDNYIII